MSDNYEVPYNYEECHDASTDAREAEEQFGETLGSWFNWSNGATTGEVVRDYQTSEAADEHAERICDFGEQDSGGNSYSLDLF